MALTFENYPYFEPTSNMPECRARARRTILFAYHSGLRPKKISDRFRKLAKNARSAMLCDHVSYWEDQYRARFILIELYHVPQGYLDALQAKGLTSCCIPTNLSPYCGGEWSTAAGAQPGTTSILICEVKHQDGLDWVAGLLIDDALSAPEWNDTGLLA